MKKKKESKFNILKRSVGKGTVMGTTAGVITAGAIAGHPELGLIAPIPLLIPIAQTALRSDEKRFLKKKLKKVV